MTPLERKGLARNIRHRLADMLGSQWNGALDAAMDEMLMDEIDKFQDNLDALNKEEAAVHVEPNDGSNAWPLRERGPNEYPNRIVDDVDVDAEEDGDPYLKGIMDKTDDRRRCRSDAPYTAPRR